MQIKIGINNASFFAYHGVYPQENKMGNHFLINSSICIEANPNATLDLNTTINYETMYHICANAMAKTQLLIENVAFDILQEYKTTFPSLISAHIRIDKLQPQLGGKMDATFVEITL